MDDIFKRRILQANIPQSDKQALMVGLDNGDVTPEEVDAALTGGESFATGSGQIVSGGGQSVGSGSGSIGGGQNTAMSSGSIGGNVVKDRIMAYPKLPGYVPPPKKEPIELPPPSAQAEAPQSRPIYDNADLLRQRLLRKEQLAKDLTSAEDLSDLRKQRDENAALQSIISSGISTLGNITGTDMSQHIKNSQVMNQIPENALKDAMRDREVADARKLQAEKITMDEADVAAGAQQFKNQEIANAQGEANLQQLKRNMEEDKLSSDPNSAESRIVQQMAIEAGLDKETALASSAKQLKGYIGTLTNLKTSKQADARAERQLQADAELRAYNAKIAEIARNDRLTEQQKREAFDREQFEYNKRMA
jgi:hypothetical protein